MDFVNGQVRVSHPRVPWDGAIRSSLIVHASLGMLNGNWARYTASQKAKYADLYQRAKYEFDMEAALDLVEHVSTERGLDAVADIIVAANQPPIFVYPYPAFDDDEALGADEAENGPTNALPFAYAAYLADVLGGTVCETIKQSARVGRTKLTKWLRFLCQPSFLGDVQANSAYILLDDVVTTGGTLASLRSYLVANGGTVYGATCLAYKGGGNPQFAVAQDRLLMLESLYSKELTAYWAWKVGHGIDCLTEGEAVSLYEWGEQTVRDHGVSRGADLLHHLGARLDRAASTGG